MGQLLTVAWHLFSRLLTSYALYVALWFLVPLLAMSPAHTPCNSDCTA